MSASNGRFVWFDLMATDLRKAKDFYTEIMGWKTSTYSEGKYELLRAADGDVGGLMPLPEELRKAGTPPHWIGYVGVDDVDATVQKAQKLGGKVLAPGTDIPDVGRYAMLADPQGAAFAVFKSNRGGSAPNLMATGQFGWAELNTTDWQSAWKFYSELFGWKKTDSMSMGPEMGEYFMFGTDPKQSMGGMSNSAKMMNAPPHWLHYVNVPSADEAAKRVTAHGGKVLNGPMDIPGGGRIAQCMDPSGAHFAVVAPAKS